jgi:hypothetical protein
MLYCCMCRSSNLELGGVKTEGFCRDRKSIRVLVSKEVIIPLWGNGEEDTRDSATARLHYTRTNSNTQKRYCSY